MLHGWSLRQELTRKALHLLSSSVPVAYALGASRNALAGVVGLGVIVATIVELGRSRHERARAMFDARFGTLLRPHEFLGVSGATWLVVSFFISIALYPRSVAIVAMCAVALGDAGAAIIGRAYGRQSQVMAKSFVGSFSCFAVTAAAAAVIARVAMSEALLAGILAALAERPRRPLDDNLRIAIVVGCGILLWRMGFS
jgi:dolichol kinase